MTTIQAIDLLNGLEQSLDDYCELNDEGKTAFRMAITALEVFGLSEQLPSAQSTQSNTPNALTALDCISRQAAIDAIYKCTDIYVNNLPIMIDKAEAYKAISELPSTQSEIVRCKDCKNWDTTWQND